MSVHLPLTTVFTPPAACTTGYYLAGTQWTNPPVVQATIEQSSFCFALAGRRRQISMRREGTHGAVLQFAQVDSRLLSRTAI
jgi:hypothetical protein